MSYVDCKEFVFVFRCSGLTGEFCYECPRFTSCTGRLKQHDMRRMILENSNKLKRLILEEADNSV